MKREIGILPKIFYMPFLGLLMLYVRSLDHERFIQLTSFWLMQTLFVWTLVQARLSRFLKVLIELPLFIVKRNFIVALIARVVSGAGLVFDTLNYSVESSFVLLQVSFFIAYLFEGPRAQVSFLMAVVERLIRLLAWATSAILIELRLYDEVNLLLELHSLNHVLLIQPGLFPELSISLGVTCDDTWLAELLR